MVSPFAWLAALALGLTACGGAPRTRASPSDPASNDTTYGFNIGSFREAGRITADAGTEVLHTLRVGQFERDIKQVVDAVFSREASGPPAFPHIVAAGPDGLDIHYPGDSRQIEPDELVLVDIGATSNQHCSDMSRTFPASGRFTARQLEIYQLVLQAQQQVATNIHSGVDALNSLTYVVFNVYRSSPLRARDATGAEKSLDAFMNHAACHYVGRDVHGADTGWSTNSPIQPNQVFTIEPGVYLPSEGIGIRIEDTYLVTKTGVECLTCAAAKDPNQIQRAR